MATDSTLEDTDTSQDEGREETSTRGTPSPPRPPRPGKRSKGSGRIPIPLPQSRPDFEGLESDALDHAPPVNIDERGEPAFPLEAARSKPPSLPEESFADIDADLADHAPNAPLTPWRGMPAVSAARAEATPPRGMPIQFSSDDEAGPSEPEPTLVGKVPDNLLELSSAVGGDENTRAFTAPRELIELARRKREERLQAVSASEEDHSKTTARPQRKAGDDAAVLRMPAAPNLPIAGLSPAGEAAPPIAHSHASELDPESHPAPGSKMQAPDSGPDIEIEPISELSPSARRAVLASTGGNPPISEPVASVTKSSPRHWLLLFALFVLLGVVIARWRELAALFR
jgi:hypothetical protein